MEKIIDLSQHNGKVDFFKIKNSGIKKVILRVGWIGNRNNHTLDTRFKEYITSALMSGCEIGIYVYSYCKTISSVINGANWVIDKIKNYKSNITLPVFIDLEDETIANLSRNELTAHARQFCSILSQNGFQAGTYANKFWWTAKLNSNELTKYKVWLAQYSNISKPQVSFRVDLWQYSSKGQVDGVGGYVDMNYCLQCDNSQNVGEITGETEKEKGEFDVKKYINGTTKEDVYQDINFTKKIGYLNPHEECSCYGIVDNLALVVYKIDKNNNKKTGFVKWLGGVK